MNTDEHGNKAEFTTEAQRRRGKRFDSFLSASLCLCVSILVCGESVFAEPPVPKFEPQTIDDKIRIGYGVVIGEVDGDGKPDILLADARQVVWYKNPGAPGKKWTKHVMASDLTQRDNVCIAARDINGDGKVEVAVGSNWNPGNTTDPEKSGAVFYLVRPDDPTQKWDAVQIEPHEPTVHRMRWVENQLTERFRLAVLPLHGVGNKNGRGRPVNLLDYKVPDDPRDEWKLTKVSTGLNLAHNFHVGDRHWDWIPVVIGGGEGIAHGSPTGNEWPVPTHDRLRALKGAGEVQWVQHKLPFMTTLVTIEPMHGNEVVWYRWSEKDEVGKRVVIDNTLRQGHALRVLPYINRADDESWVGPAVVAGWRMPNADKKVGIKMYVPQDEKGEKWSTHVIDDNKMACEDMAVGDLDGDGRLDIVASGRATRNVIVYWNKSEVKKAE